MTDPSALDQHVELDRRFTVRGAEVDLTVGRALRIERQRDLLDTTQRSTIAESIVAWATKGKQGTGWNPNCDVTLEDGTTIEVKSSARLWSVPGARDPLIPTARPSFDLPAVEKRTAEVWVFAYLDGENPCLLDDWVFY